jgi:glycosyltransferase involved in cell wall biosynthesis
MYVSWANSSEWNLRVFFASSIGLNAYHDRDFGTSVQWDSLGLEHFDHQFLNGGQAISITNEIDAPELDAALAAFDPDAVLVYGYAHALQQRATRWARRNRKKVLFISDAERIRRRPWYIEVGKWFALRRYFRKIDHFLTVGNANEAYYQLYGAHPRRLTRLGFAIDVAMYEKAYAERGVLRVDARRRLALSDDDVLCAVVGKLVPHKRQADLIEALLLSERRSQARRIVAVIIGTGTQQADLVARAARLSFHRVVFAGFAKPQDLPSYYSATDIYVHTSEREPHSLAISEALYMGCPVLVSDACGSYGTTDDVQIGRSGLIYPCGDTSELSRQLHRLACDGALRAELGSFGHTFLVESQQRAHGDGLRAALRAQELL